MDLKTIIIVQNLRIGGFQRIALDEAYGLASMNLESTLITLENSQDSNLVTFESTENDLILKHNLDIKCAKGGRLRQLIYFTTFVGSSKQPLRIISHSLRATVLIWCARFICRKELQINTVIHQLPSLSKPIQRYKRFIYSLCSDKLFIFSLGAKKDWDEKIHSSFILKLLFTNKPINLLRNGVYLDRLPLNNCYVTAGKTSGLRLIFLGRPTKWKGVDTVLKLVELPNLSHAKIVFYFPYENPELFDGISGPMLKRISLRVGETIRDYSPAPGDVHLYPTNYGENRNFTESISINCLEMAAIGTPSIVTKGGLETWPEFLQTTLVTEVNWSDLHQTSEKILQVASKQISESEFISSRNFISIFNHLNQLI